MYHYTFLTTDEAERITEWLYQSFPFTSWGRINWSRLPGYTCYPWDIKAIDLVDTFQSLCHTESLQNVEVVILWTNMLIPLLQCKIEAVRACAAAVFETDFDTWIVCQEHQWCIEVYHEGELCFGRITALGQP